MAEGQRVGALDNWASSEVLAYTDSSASLDIPEPLVAFPLRMGLGASLAAFPLEDTSAFSSVACDS